MNVNFEEIFNTFSQENKTKTKDECTKYTNAVIRLRQSYARIKARREQRTTKKI
ncbi:hypothetical protein DSLPV1_198 [Dishui lake phycodnavirus 1]|uniref:hypothetical protein n=1 Tax=Dishui lake phycodnavirus 1 TaxID=2079134 RepID=UPI000CD67778|nr:hypothetical protein C5Y57_gp200 [Dishui lake phycodnavirus 1]AUT19169.1 hypothetical protein DSLPV1_198 [Dishui lake phycodnavirus 1]